MLVPLLPPLSKQLIGLVLAPAHSIPIWDQYVSLIRKALDELAQLLHNGGLAIIAFTIIVKTLVLPLTVQSIRSSKAMQELQPKIKELQKKHGKDRQRLTQETMRLYSEHRVNPMAGCLPMLLQIPIFLGLYQGINELSRRQGGYWDDRFLWLTDGLAKPDPFYILPFLAAIFQFVQTRMMRPYKMGKITDPQQAMMNSLMNFMPLTVIFFGLTFASGPVLYWATQSIYSVVQQWFITGWGSLRDWFEWLPELPEHRRLGYRPPRPLDDVVVVSGSDDGQPVRPPGVMGWVQRRMEAAQQQAAVRRGGDASDAQARADDESRAIAEEAAATPRAAGGNGSGRRRARSGQRAKSGARTAGTSAATRAETATRTNGQAERADGAPRAVVVPRKARPAPKDDGKGRG